MKFTFKYAVGTLAAAALMFTAASASAADPYKIACDAAYAPFSWEVNGQYVGIDVEILDAVAKAGGFEYELKPMNFDAIIPGLVAGQLDGSLGGMSITEARQKVLDFATPYFDSGLSVITREDSKVTKPEDLKGMKAAIKKGTTGAVFVENNLDKLELTSSYYTTSPETMLAVKNKMADFVMEDYPVIAYQIKIGAQKGLKIAIPRVTGVTHYGFAVKKGQNAELLKKFNEGLAKIKADGTYEKIVGKYL